MVGTTGTETSLLNALRDGDESAFAELVERYHGPLTRLARSFGATDAVADEIVQDTWMGVLQGLDRFEERASLKTWLFTILKNQARTRATREKRSVPLSALVREDEEGDDGPIVDPSRFHRSDGRWAEHWSSPPRAWSHPDVRLDALETREHLRDALASLPPRQQLVVALRDVEGLTSNEVCEVLEISEANQRVLLHRGRSTLRNTLEEYLDA
jgi:RNA polymerase sigma-70 factor (ECF subfamily)